MEKNVIKYLDELPESSAIVLAAAVRRSVQDYMSDPAIRAEFEKWMKERKKNERVR